MDTAETQVLVVGAGPTGLTLACDLARRGVDCRVVDRAPQPHRRSRGKGLQPRSLEVFDDLGIAEAALGAGRRDHHLRLYTGGRLTADLTVRAGRRRPGVPFPDLVVIPQWRTEQLLRDRLAVLGREVEHGRELRALQQDDDAVVATVAGPGPERVERVRAAFVVGCDGGHSTVRERVGLELRGSGRPQHFVLGDVRVDGLDPDASVAWFDGADYLAADPLSGDGTWQVQASVHPDAAGRFEPASVELFQRLFEQRGFPDVHVHDATWLSDYSPRVAMVDRYRVGRVLLAGDAAHVHSPAGGQGMNTGIQDAHALGWRLGLVLRGTAAPALLDTYEEERLPVARSVLAGSDVGHSVVFSPHPVARVLRERLLAPLLRVDAVQRAVLDRTAELDVGYRGSSLSRERPVRLADLRWRPGPGEESLSPAGRLRFHRGPRAGDRAPDAHGRDAEGRPERLFDRFRGPHATVLLFAGTAPGDVGARAAALAARVRTRYPGDVAAVVVVAGERAPAGPATDALFLDPAREAHRRYGAGAGALYLVRPDGYVGLRSPVLDEAALTDVLDPLYAGRRVPVPR